MDTPQMSIEEAITEAQRDLWTLRQMQPPGPVGAGIPYLCPARFYIKEIQLALRRMVDAEGMALEEIPTDIKAGIDQDTRRFGPGEVEDVAGQAPEVRRYVAVRRVRELVAWLVEDLENEGKSRPAQRLKLKRAKSTRDKEREHL